MCGSLVALWHEREQSNNDSSKTGPLKPALSGSAYSCVTNWRGSADVADLRGLMELYVDEHQVMYNLPRLPSV